MGYIQQYISDHSPSAFHQALEKYHVDKLYAFGSSVEASIPEDIDILVEIVEKNPLKKGDYILDLWDYLEDYFGRKVDLLTPESLQNRILRKAVSAGKIL
ncbi:MAG: nucleotidyltransferase domain-containing protein, partial [Bacteroidota bacterium]